ncbi:undecaprenyl/decaprenyl-phosphate alpha-N-acetylglucosaminyl 1-phosphate transferase [Candidatus Uhrbacteria bacterium]|nr:undecaprenyl/decaprenyl-phosphate alpha-N-acetylglucosaminyl 1-phosphate transferase [Candidatus Uhrbacteria bacterium]
MSFILVPLAAFAVAALVTPLVARFAVRAGVVDRPTSPRKVHTKPVPLLGGWALWLGLAAAIATAIQLGAIPGPHIKEKFLLGILLATLLLVVGGSLDDRFDLRPAKQIVWPVLAALVIIMSGIGVTAVTNPFGGLLYLDRWQFTAVTFGGIPYKITVIADLFTLAWLLGMTYTTKFFDGLDGLVSGVTVIGGLVIAAVSLTKDVAQPDTAFLALGLAGASLGFLVWNFHPARIFLGEGGSTLAGFMLGVLAIVSGGKIATTLLVLGLPLFDAAFVIVRRLLEGKSPALADRSHLHHRLLDLGFSHRQAVLFMYAIAAAFGASTLVLRGAQKVAALGFLLSILIAIVAASLAAKRKTYD